MRRSGWARVIDERVALVSVCVDHEGQVAVRHHGPVGDRLHLVAIGVPDALELGDRPRQVVPVRQMGEALLVDRTRS